MRTYTNVLAFLATGILAACDAPVPSQDAPADLMLVNANVYTVNPAQPRAQAVAISGDRILAVGSMKALHSRIGPSTHVVDLEGQFVVPGFIDNHTHFDWAGALLLGADLLRIHDEDEFVQEITRVVGRLPEGSWIVGGAWGAYEQWAEGSAGGDGTRVAPFMPFRQLIDDITRSHPVLLHRFDRSVYLANALALDMAGIDVDTADPDGGTIERDSDGEPTGLLRGTAVDLVRNVIHEKSWEQRLAESRRALSDLRRSGVTSIQDITNAPQLRIYQHFLRESELTVRVWARPDLDMVEHLAAIGIETGFGGNMLRIGGLKGYLDGIMGNSSALFYQAYDHDPGNYGKLEPMMSPEGNMLRLLRLADEARLVPGVHAIGDKAINMLLDLYAEVIEEGADWDRRFRIVHSQVVGPGDFSRYGQLGILAEVQPYHLSDDMRWMEERIGHERSRGAYAFRTLKEGGARVSFGSDWPGTNASYYPSNALMGLYAAVTRKTLDGEPEGGWFRDEKLTIEEAIAAYTIESAWAAYEENEKGSIEPGKLADFAVLSEDLTAIPGGEIIDVEVVMTILGGKIVYPE